MPDRHRATDPIKLSRAGWIRAAKEAARLVRLQDRLRRNMGNEMTCTLKDIDDLRPRWQETFGEQMPFGFGIGVEDVPMLRECLDTKSREPLDRHMETLDLENEIY